MLKTLTAIIVDSYTHAWRANKFLLYVGVACYAKERKNLGRIGRYTN